MITIEFLCRRHFPHNCHDKPNHIATNKQINFQVSEVFQAQAARNDENNEKIHSAILHVKKWFQAHNEVSLEDTRSSSNTLSIDICCERLAASQAEEERKRKREKKLQLCR